VSDKPWHRDVPKRVTEYLSAGGLFNPELMDHKAVQAILLDARDVIEIIARERPGQETRACKHFPGQTKCDWCPPETNRSPST
jgi:hypothetical protein